MSSTLSLLSLRPSLPVLLMCPLPSPASADGSGRLASIYPHLHLQPTPNSSSSSSRSASARPPLTHPKMVIPSPATTSTSTRPRTVPKTWSNTAPARQARSYSSRSLRFSPSSSSTSAAASAAAKEAALAALESGLEYYTYRKPVTCSLASGLPFLSHTSPFGSSPSSPRLRSPGVGYTTTLAEATDLVHCLGRGPYALDLEWNFNHRRSYKTALLQIASPSLVVLVHLSRMKKLPEPLVALLTDEKAIKTGVSIRNDALKLERDFDVTCRGLVELSALARRLDAEAWEYKRGPLVSLRDLTRVYLGRKLRKEDVRTSDWTTMPLSEQQQEYAVNDVVASLEILRVLAAKVPQNLSIDQAIAEATVHLPSTSRSRSTQQKKDKENQPPTAIPPATLTPGLLAHHRAYALYTTAPYPTLISLSNTLRIQPTTVASYIYQSLCDPHPTLPGFNPEDWKRLLLESKPHPFIHQKIAELVRKSHPPARAVTAFHVSLPLLQQKQGRTEEQLASKPNIKSTAKTTSPSETIPAEPTSEAPLPVSVWKKIRRAKKIVIDLT
ncbi:hypothetical protein ACQY0O_008191 [Thecaphora frezii]